MNIDELDERMNETMQEFLGGAVGQFTAEDCGLDSRASYSKLWVSDTWICCKANADRDLQYYGGFEYVDKDFRREVGSYVVYFADDGRVQKHIDVALGHEDE